MKQTRIIPHRWALVLTGAALALLLALTVALAAGEQLSRSATPSTSGPISGGGYTMETSVGQPVVAASSSDSNTVCSGILCGSGAPSESGGSSSSSGKIYLPYLSR